MSLYIKPLTLSIALALSSANSFAIAAEASEEESAVELDSLTVTASADASAEGLSPAFEGGQVAEGGRAGILGTKDHLETPFSITSYTNDFIQDRQAKSVGDVLQADPVSERQEVSVIFRNPILSVVSSLIQMISPTTASIHCCPANI